MGKYFILFISTFLFSQSEFETSFITPFEYGKMLYENPRGISCAKCHGDDARGKNIAKFKHISRKKTYDCTVKSPDITKVSYNDFIHTLDPKLEKPKKKFSSSEVCEKLIYGNIMPTYFLTKEELKSIHLYLSTKDKYE